MNNNSTCHEEVRQGHSCHTSSGLLIAVVLYILLVIILSSLRGC